MRTLAAVIVALTAVSAAALSPACPCIVGLSPAVARSNGGDVITLTGISFHSPVRVFVDFDSRSIEAAVINVTGSRLQFLAPTVDLNGKPILVTTIRAVFDSGTQREWRAASLIPLIYQNFTLAPSVLAVVPQSGPLAGGARVSILGQGFQAPVQVFFGGQEAQVLSISFSQIVVIAPANPRVGPVDVRLNNINSNTSTVVRDGFRYVDSMRLTAITPNSGATTGLMRVTIQGSGFEAPLAVSIAGHVALPIRISATEIIAVTTPAFSQPCTSLTGPVTVTNIETGDSVTGLEYTYTCTSRRRVGR